MTRGMIAGALLALMAAEAAAQSCTDDAVIVFDGSGSMAETGFNAIGAPRITEARQAVHEVLPAVAPTRRLGLVLYGASGAQSCTDARLVLEPQPEAAGPILAEIDALRPSGETALTEAVKLAAEVLRRGSGQGDVVLVTDGKETCGGTPCALATTLMHDAPGITVHVIGFKVRGEHWDWSSPETEGVSVARCLAEDTGGTYVNAETLEELIGALRVTLGCNVFGALERRRLPG